MVSRRITGFVFLFLHSFFAFSQNIQVSAPEPLYNFGYVRESGGLVYHTFSIENSGTDTAFVKQVSVSCGCTQTNFNQSFILPGKKINMVASYDPMGRPGFFNKTIEVVLSGDTTERRVLFILRGQVIQKEILPAVQTDRSNWQLVLKPYLGEMDGPFDNRFLENEAFQDFINDITYEIDKEGAAHVQLEVFSLDEAHKNDWNLIYAASRQRIGDELVRRDYSPNQVFFTARTPRKSIIADQRKTNLVKISSVLYNNDFAAQSVMISPTQVPVPDFESVFTMLRADSSGIIYEYIQQGESMKLLKEQSGFLEFIKQSVRYALMNTGISIQVGVKLHTTGNMNAETWIKKQYPALCKEIMVELNNEGIDKASVQFIVPVVEEDSIKNEISLRVINESKRKTSVSDIFLDFDAYTQWLQHQEDSVKPSGNEINQGLYLPAYYHYFSRDVPFDTSGTAFSKWMNEMAAQISKGKKIKFLVEASASNSPSSKGLENDYIARKRAKSAEQWLIMALRKRGLKGSELVGVKFAYVHGPLYDEKSYLLQFYDKYQYVRIIPYEERVIDKKDFQAVKPYQINFNTNSFRLPANSPVFRSFIQRILVLIKKYGYLEINLESSSSTSPTLDFRNNYVLSYHRIQHTRDVLRTELLRNGIDPARLIVREERALVQGPRYSPDMLNNRALLERYQYVKILPFSTR